MQISHQLQEISPELEQEPVTRAGQGFFFYPIWQNVWYIAVWEVEVKDLKMHSAQNTFQSSQLFFQR